MFAGASADEMDEKRWEDEVKNVAQQRPEEKSLRRSFCDFLGIDLNDGKDHSLYMRLWFKIFDKFK